MPRRVVDREQAARLQRERRARITRVDFTATAETEGAIEVMQRAMRKLGWWAASRSGALNAIVGEWIKAGRPMPPPPKPCGAHVPTYMYGPLRKLECSYDASGELQFPPRKKPEPRAAQAPNAKAICGGKRHRDGGVCQSKPEPGRTRCRFHGGRSTARGPVTEAGKARALANLRRGKVPGPGARRCT